MQVLLRDAITYSLVNGIISSVYKGWSHDHPFIFLDKCERLIYDFIQKSLRLILTYTMRKEEKYGREEDICNIRTVTGN